MTSRTTEKFIKSESGAIKKRGAPAPRWKDCSRSEDAVKDAERGTAERRAAGSILDGSPSGGYNGQNHLQKGAPLYCVAKDLLKTDASRLVVTTALLGTNLPRFRQSPTPKCTSAVMPFTRH